MRKTIAIIIICLSGSGTVLAQWATPAISLSGVTGVAKWNKYKFPSYGYSASFETIGPFSLTASYQHLSGKHEMETVGGTAHLKLTQNYFRFLVGYGGPIPIAKSKGSILIVSAQYGFLSGRDRLNIYHEYPNGTISYGMDKTYTGVFTAIRSLSSILNFKVLHTNINKRVFFFGSAEKVFRKKRDLFEFWDQNDIKYSYLAVNSGGGSSGFLPVNNINGWNFHLGIGVTLKKLED